MLGICLQSIATLPSQDVNPEVKKLLEEFEDSFQEPTQHPLSREVDHHINLKRGTEPINVKPYRYAYFEAKIEKQVKDMLKLGTFIKLPFVLIMVMVNTNLCHLVFIMLHLLFKQL